MTLEGPHPAVFYPADESLRRRSPPLQSSSKRRTRVSFWYCSSRYQCAYLPGLGSVLSLTQAVLHCFYQAWRCLQDLNSLASRYADALTAVAAPAGSALGPVADSLVSARRAACATDAAPSLTLRLSLPTAAAG